MRKKCKTCKYGQCTFGSGLKEEYQLWECNATLGIVPSCKRSHVPVTPNYYCDWWNQPEATIKRDIEAREKEAEKLRNFQKGFCLGKIDGIKSIKVVIESDEE